MTDRVVGGRVYTTVREEPVEPGSPAARLSEEVERLTLGLTEKARAEGADLVAVIVIKEGGPGFEIQSAVSGSVIPGAYVQLADELASLRAQVLKAVAKGGTGQG